MRNMHATCVHDMRCLHTCMLQVCYTSVSCMYAYYYSAAYMPLAHMQATSIPHMCNLHTCISTVLRTCRLHVFLICAACIHAYYYSATYMPLTHMQATSIPHICSLHKYMHVTTVLHTCRLHTCKLLAFLICAACIHAYYYSAAYMPLTHMQATSVPHMCSLHTCILLQCCIHAASHIMIFIYQ